LRRAAASSRAAAIGRRLLLPQTVNRVRVVIRVPDAVAVGVNEPDRPLKQPGLRVPLWRDSFEDIEPVLVHREIGEVARFVGVRELQEITFDDLLKLKVVVGDLGVQ
jgi:hypothetical protein